MRAIRGKITRWILVLLAAIEILMAMSIPVSALQASFTASQTSGAAPLTVAFEPQVSGGIQPYYYLWTFGDGQSSSERSPTHTFTMAGDYTVTLAVTCSCQPPTTDYSTQIIEVGKATSSINSSFSASPSNGIAPLNVTFTSTASGGTPPYSYDWNFGDGNSSSEADPTHTFLEPGSYTVVLVVRSSDAGIPASTSSEMISVRRPFQVLVSAEAGIGVAPLVINFSSLVEGGSPDYSYLWSFGDGNVSTEANASHLYEIPGDYVVRLKVTDSDSNIVSSESLRIEVVAPQQEVMDSHLLIFGLVVPTIVGMVGIAIWMSRRRAKG